MTGHLDAARIATHLEFKKAMKLILYIVLLAQILAPSLSHAAEPSTCLKANLRTDAAMTRATLRVAGERRPTFSTQDWAPDGAHQPGFFDYTLDIRRNVLPEGREYPLVIRLAPDMVAISLRKLMGSATTNTDRLCEDVALATDGEPQDTPPPTLLNGYAFFKNGRPAQISPISADSRLPSSFVDHYANWLRRSQDFYRSLLGAESRDVASILFLTDQDETGRNGCLYAGSSLPGLLLIGLRSGCLDGKQDLPGDLPHFVAHEAFHQWNFTVSVAERDPAAKAIRLMLLEGGAELAAGLFLSQARTGGNDDMERHVGAAAEACIDAAAHQGQPIVKLVNDGRGRIAYSCGAVYTFLRMAPLARKPIDAFALFWRSVLAAPSKDVRSRDPSLDAAFSTETPSLSALDSLFSGIGYRLSIAEQPDKAQRFHIAVELLREISRNDCRGSHGLFTGAGEIVIDASLTQCQHLRGGGRPVTVDGFDIYAAPMQARAAWLSACDAGATVRVTYKGSDVEPSAVACTSRPKDLYTPLRLSHR